MRFAQWLEAQNDIRVLGYNKRGDIGFDVRGTRYVFNTDAGRFYNGVLARMIKYQPGRAFNELRALVKAGAAEQIEPQQKEPPLNDGGSERVQRRLF